MSISDEFPLVEEEQQTTEEPTPTTGVGTPVEDPGSFRVPQEQPRKRFRFDNILRVITYVVAIASIGALAWTARWYFTSDAPYKLPAFLDRAAFAAPAESNAPSPLSSVAMQVEQPEAETTDVILPPFPTPEALMAFAFNGVPRLAMLHTTIPNRARIDVVLYEVQLGDSVFAISEKFNLRPETIFWGNKELLGDNPHELRAGQELNILPTDGVYHRWSAGENFTKVASFYGVSAEDIVEYPGNEFDLYSFDLDNPDLEAGEYLIVPGGTRALIDWGPPRITRDNPAVASTYGPGHCGTITDGAVGTGLFIWPTTAKFLSGYDYNPAANHPAIDIGGSLGNAIYAVDSGVVVYAGWSYYGYGNLIVLDHGNSQSLYAHLSTFNVSCGQSVFQGTVIGGLGSTGNSTGPHLHFELMYNGYKVNPWNYLTQ